MRAAQDGPGCRPPPEGPRTALGQKEPQLGAGHAGSGRWTQEGASPAARGSFLGQDAARGLDAHPRVPFAGAQTSFRRTET